MRVPNFRHAGDWIVGGVTVMVLAAPVLYSHDIEHFRENAPIELSQCVLAGVAGLFFLMAAMRAADRLSALALGWLSIFCLVVLLREVEFGGTPLEAWLGSAVDKDLDYVLIGILAFALFLLSLRNIATLARAMIGWVIRGPGRLIVAGVVFYLLGDIGDKGLVSANADTNLIFEESFELLGTLFFFLCAYATLRLRTVFVPTSSQRKP